MPANDLVLNVRQIAGYPPAPTALPADSIVIQRGGLGGPYMSIDAAEFVGTALSSGGAMTIGGALSVLSVAGGSAQFSNATFGLLSAQKACLTDFEATWGSVNALTVGATLTAASAQLATLGVAGDMQLGGTANLANAVVQNSLSVGGATFFGDLTVNNLAVCNIATITTGLVVEGNFAVVNGTATIDGFPIVTAGNLGGVAPIASPAFTGNPTAPTPPTTPTDNSTSIATTAFVVTVVNQLAAGVSAAYAPLASPNFSGLPAAPTAAPGTSTAQLATTAFVQEAIVGSTTGVSSFNTRTGAVTLTSNDLTGAGGALLNSPAFIGTPSAPTPTTGNASGLLATTQFVQTAIAAINLGVTTFNTRSGAVTLSGADITAAGGALASNAAVASFNGRTGAITLTNNDVSAAGGAVLNSPAFTGVPTAPTAAPSTSTTQLATCAFVEAAVMAATAGVTSFNGRTGVVVLNNPDVVAVLPSSAALPVMNGTANAGSATAWSRSDHVHPTDTSLYPASNPSGFQTAAQVTTAVNTSVPLAGGTMTGGLTTPGLTVASLANDTPTITLTGGSGVSRLGLYWTGPLGTVTQNFNVATYTQLDNGGSFAYVGGSGTATKTGGGVWATASDARIKTVHGDYQDGLDAILAMRPVRYSYKGNDSLSVSEASPHAYAAQHATPFVGFIAQELETICPDMVTQKAGFIDGEAVSDLRNVDVSNLVFALVNAVKTLAARVAALEAT